MLREDWIFRRGDIYLANLNPYFGSEQGGIRPVLVLQNNTGNYFCPTLIVAPMTSKTEKKRNLPTHLYIDQIRDKVWCPAQDTSKSGICSKNWL